MFTFYSYRISSSWLSSRYSYGKTRWWDLLCMDGRGKKGKGGGHEGPAAAQDPSLRPEPQPDAKPGRLHGRKEADGQQVCLQLGSIEETEANHTVYYTPDSPVQRSCCICVCCSGFL